MHQKLGCDKYLRRKARLLTEVSPQNLPTVAAVIISPPTDQLLAIWGLVTAGPGSFCHRYSAVPETGNLFNQVGSPQLP